jgi:hypothetical protein
MSQILNQAEELRKQAIGILMTERQEIDRQLALLGADGTESPITKRKVCSVCASPDHNARFHKKESGGTAAHLQNQT